MSARPRVTLALPLYRSARVLDVVAANLAGIPRDVEILVGDRHLEDDAAERIRELLGDRPGVRFLLARDAIDWVAHYDLLLREASGEHFLWMPHDDSYPADWIPRLSAALDAHPDAICAFGRMEAESLDGRRTAAWEEPPFTNDEPWDLDCALRLLFAWNPGLAMRGVFRREALLRAGHSLPRPPRLEHADGLFVFGAALLGRFVHDPETTCRKRFHEGSAHASWRRIHSLARLRILLAEAERLLPEPGGAKRKLVAGTLASIGISLGNRLAPGLHLDRRRRALLGRMFGG